MKMYVLDDDHKPVEADMETAARWMANDDVRRVAETHVGKSRISTVFLGIDHNFFGMGPPILFETMVFGGPLDELQDRYVSWDDAETGHLVTIRRVKEAYASIGEIVSDNVGPDEPVRNDHP